MTAQRLALGLTAVNLAILVLNVGRPPWPAPSPAEGAADVAPVLRGRALELVDENGRVRSRLNVEEGGAVVLRLIDRNGSIRVKLGADENGSGLVLLDEATEPGLHLVARRAGTPERPATSLTLRGADGQRVIRP
jgi:hypothetical protein